MRLCSGRSQRASAPSAQSILAENAGVFWGLIKTRPYMRARLALGELLAAEGSPRKAINHFEGLLEVNPHDNQGVRYPLLSVYLRQRDLKGAQSLFSRYEHECGIVFLWGRVLERFLANDLTKARAAPGINILHLG